MLLKTKPVNVIDKGMAGIDLFQVFGNPSKDHQEFRNLKIRPEFFEEQFRLGSRQWRQLDFKGFPVMQRLGMNKVIEHETGNGTAQDKSDAGICLPPVIPEEFQQGYQFASSRGHPGKFVKNNIMFSLTYMEGKDVKGLPPVPGNASRRPGLIGQLLHEMFNLFF